LALLPAALGWSKKGKTMKNSPLRCVLLLHAQTAPLSRADVKADFLRARAAGELPSSADLFGPALQQAMQTARTKPADQSTAQVTGAEQRPLLTLPQSAASAIPR
jgi:hypothetical protein